MIIIYHVLFVWYPIVYSILPLKITGNTVT